MNIPWKKILILTGFSVIVILLGWLIYYLFFRSAITPGRPSYVQEGTGLPGELPGVVNVNERPAVNGNVNAGLPAIGEQAPEASAVARGSLTQTRRLTNGPVQGVTVAPDGSLIYYDEASGKFYRRLADGTVVELAAQIFHDVENITWAKQANQAILEYPDGSNILYNFDQDKQYTLPREMQDFSFSLSGSKIASEIIGPNAENNWLITANPDGSGIQFVEQIGNKMEDVQVGWSPNNQVVATYRESYDANRQEVILIGQNHENFKSFIPQGRGFEGQWTPKGDQLLYSVYSADENFRPKLWLTAAGANNFGYNNVSLNLNTWADKCTINQKGTAAYCAVPEDLPLGSAWYPELAEGVRDDFYYVDLKTGRYSLLAVPSGAITHSASQVYLSPDESELYFVDQTDSNIYSLDLP
ncbi:MAG: hypothetical protein UW91_C0060G0003 [Parcubacteria group bacterium GW2011_GWF2_45_11]|nr:MAG: hypothetical protein UW91_C0060G0003 [Parcubacteria group bacterium GW2011_GWF2_45_11]OGY95049.1 MAG: hypothetical protein A3J95_04485 [Candidatus Komeilibacteria bacterium RIFOXYC2_FULL_45_12]HBR13117.1 hypothetical protein [Candidatus Komeilibacteria bacterium]